MALRLEGPSHLHLAIRGDVRGWEFEGVESAPKPRLRAEGVYFVQLTCGRPRCNFELRLTARGPVDVTLAAHHMEATSRDLEALRLQLPAWAVGAEWGSFVSELVARRV